MGSKYVTQATSGYASSPPSDDGAQTEANKVKFSTIRQKLTDVLKTFVEAINSQLVTVLNTSARAITASDSAAATDHWRTIQVNTSSVTVTLADATTMAAGYIVNVANQSSGAVTVALATATDTIDGVTNTTQLLGPKETREYIVSAAATGYITKSSRVSFNDLTEDTAPDLGADYVAAYDASGTILKKVLMGRVGSGVLGTEAATTSGSAHDFTIPAWAKEVAIEFSGVSTNGTGAVKVQLGDSGGIETTGYLGSNASVTNGVSPSAGTATDSFQVSGAGSAAAVLHGRVVISLEDAANFTWVESGVLGRSDAGGVELSGGTKPLSAALTTVRVLTADTFDAGALNVLYR